MSAAAIPWNIIWAVIVILIVLIVIFVLLKILFHFIALGPLALPHPEQIYHQMLIYPWPKL